ncbi:MAG: glycosyltransferase family 4 protein [Smithella sp.]
MKIALICDWFHPRIGGIEIHLQGLAESLQAAGHQPEIITATKEFGRAYGFPVHRLDVPVKTRFGFISSLSAFRQVEFLLKKGSFDVAHCHGSILSPLAYGSVYVAKKLQIPTVVTCHSVLHYYNLLFFLLDRLFGWSKWPVLFASVSPSAARIMSKAGRINQVYVLPNAVRESSWRRPRLSRPHDDLTLISVMRLSIRKRAHVLIKMMPEILRLAGSRRVRLIIVGDGTQRSFLTRLIKRLGLQEVVELAGIRSQQEIADAFSRADIFVLPTNQEAFGLAALEARVAGLPVVGMRMSGLQHLIEDGKEGLLASDDDEFVRHLAALIQNDELRERIALHNRTVSTIWNWQFSLARHLEIYENARREFGHGQSKKEPSR